MRVARVGDGFALGSVGQSDVSKGATMGISGKKQYNSRAIGTYAEGTSRTKIHLTSKIPFHLSCAHTLDVFVSSTLLGGQYYNMDFWTRWFPGQGL